MEGMKLTGGIYRGGEEIFREVFQRYGDSVYALLLTKCGEPRLAREILKEVFQEVYEQIITAGTVDVTSIWLNSIALGRLAQKRLAAGAQQPEQPRMQPQGAPQMLPSIPAVQPAPPIPAVQPAPIPAVQPAPIPAMQPAPIPAVQPAPIPAVQPTPIPAVQSTPTMPTVQPAEAAQFAQPAQALRFPTQLIPPQPDCEMQVGGYTPPPFVREAQQKPPEVAREESPVRVLADVQAHTGAAAPGWQLPGLGLGTAVPKPVQAAPIPREPAAEPLSYEPFLQQVARATKEKGKRRGERRKPRDVGNIGRIVLIVALSVLIVITLWMILGLLMDIKIIKGADLGYQWFNETFFPLF